MDVTEVALATVTDEFVRHMREAPALDLEEATGFVVVAATLLDLKAARLLPGAEVEDDADLAALEARDLLFARLLQYRAFRDAADHLGRMLVGNAGRAPRPGGEPVGVPPPDVPWTLSPAQFARLAADALRPRPAEEVATEHLHGPPVSIDDQRELLLARLGRTPVPFSQLIADAQGAATVVARFLALLDLYRDGVVVLHQDVPMGEFVVDRTQAPGRSTDPGRLP
jgi:segregation and condensation protein A